MNTDAKLTLRPSRPFGRTKRIVLAIASALALVGAVVAAVKTAAVWSSPPPVLATVEIDRGDIDHVVTETGSVQGADDDLVRCEVESFLSLPAPAAVGHRDRQSAVVKSRVVANAALASTAVTGARASGSTAKPKAKSHDQQSGGPASGRKNGSQPEEKPTSPTSANAKDPSGLGAPVEAAGGVQRPVIRSFDHSVEPYVPLRSVLADQGTTATIVPPPPTILSIVAEGSAVSRGDVVCELDSSGFVQALEVQRFRFLRAKAWVEQAGYILEAGEIALREYQQGILPQDIQLVRQYIGICETDHEQAASNLKWSRATFDKGFRTQSAVEADIARLQLSEVTVRDARTMLDRLVRYTGKKNLAAHRAKVAAIRADKLSLEASFRMEQERLTRIEAMIAHCTMRAPRDGIVVYANRTRGGNGEMQIREGVTVYQTQPIFRLLDASRMHIEARINESQVAYLRAGQPVMIHLDAFPDRTLKGSVADIMPMPSFPQGQFLDVHSFIANIRIESGGFAALRSGLTAELRFLVESRRRVPRVPLEAVRWFDDQTFAAVVSSTEAGHQWLWRPIEVGATDTAFAEVVSGLAPGDRVVAHVENLPPEGVGPPDTTVMMDLALEDHSATGR